AAKRGDSRRAVASEHSRVRDERDAPRLRRQVRARDRAEACEHARPDINRVAPVFETNYDSPHPLLILPPSPTFFPGPQASPSSAAVKVSAMRSKLGAPPHTSRANSSTVWREAVFQTSINSSPAAREENQRRPSRVRRC